MKTLERLTYPDNTFDLFVTQDVLEHVFNPDRAVAEILRVVKPGGAHVFTAPKHKGLRLTAQRAALEQGEIRYLLDPQYHGNPIGDGRALVTWDYGDDFEAYLWAWCGYPTDHIRDPRSLARARWGVSRGVRDEEDVATLRSVVLTPPSFTEVRYCSQHGVGVRLTLPAW